MRLPPEVSKKERTSSLTSKTLRPTNLILEILRSVLQATRLTLIGAIATPAAQTMANATKLLLSLPQLSPTLKLLNLSRKMISRALTSRDPPTWPPNRHIG